MRILAWRGQVVEGFGARSKTLVATIGHRTALGTVVKANDWNQDVVIARGGTFVHVVNGQLMAVMIDDDPMSSNNQPRVAIWTMSFRFCVMSPPAASVAAGISGAGDGTGHSHLNPPRISGAIGAFRVGFAMRDRPERMSLWNG